MFHIELEGKIGWIMGEGAKGMLPPPSPLKYLGPAPPPAPLPTPMNASQHLPINAAAPIAQCVTCWPADLAVLGSRPTVGGIFLIINGLPLHTAFH